MRITRTDGTVHEFDTPEVGHGRCPVGYPKPHDCAASNCYADAATLTLPGELAPEMERPMVFEHGGRVTIVDEGRAVQVYPHEQIDPVTGQPRPFTGYVYLAGPMTGLPEYNFPAFHAAAAELAAVGLGVWNPASADNAADGFDPKTDVALTHAHYMVRDLPAVAGSLGVATLPDWHRSKGARLEATVALALDLPVRPVQEWIAESINTTAKEA